MPTTSHATLSRTRYHQDAYQFLYAALRHSQRKLGRLDQPQLDEDEAHVSGPELLEGVRDLAVKQFGLLSNLVFAHWGIRSTGDIGRMVFNLIDRGEMRKSDSDHLEDFIDVYDFEDAFDRDYRIDTSYAFSH